MQTRAQGRACVDVRLWTRMWTGVRGNACVDTQPELLDVLSALSASGPVSSYGAWQVSTAPALSLGGSCELVIAFAPHRTSRLAAPLLRAALHQLHGQARAHGNGQGELELEVDLGLLPSSGMLSVTVSRWAAGSRHRRVHSRGACHVRSARASLHCPPMPCHAMPCHAMPCRPCVLLHATPCMCAPRHSITRGPYHPPHKVLQGICSRQLA